MKAYYSLTSAVVILSLLLSCKKKGDTTVTIADPLVATSAVTNITSNSAASGGNVTDASHGNVTARGVCWGVNLFPTIEANSKTIDGSGLGSYSSMMTGLQINKTYYVRAYATNEEGTGYGDNIMFTTSPFTAFSYGNKTIYVHPADSIYSVWGTSGVITGGTSSTNGSDNTQYIASQGGVSAAKKCADLVAFGFDDWYLPSSDELNVMYQNKAQIGGFNHADYWSSTEANSTTAASQSFMTGVQTAMSNKNLVKSCRCVRKD